MALIVLEFTAIIMPLVQRMLCAFQFLISNAQNYTKSRESNWMQTLEQTQS